MNKNSKLLIIVGVLAVIAIGISLAYFATGINFKGEGSETNGTAAELISVKYDAGSSILTSNNMVPNDSISKEFKITVAPSKDMKKVTYAIKLVLSSNTFEYCDEDNYNAESNDCLKNEKELIYTLKDKEGKELATGNLTGVSGEVEIITETKEVNETTDFNYVFEIAFKNTGKDQNHNINKVLTGDVKVIFADEVVSNAN